jgi:hypothetical protein
MSFHANLDIGGLLGNLAQAGGTFYGFDKGLSDSKAIGDEAISLANTFSDKSTALSKFKPFALTSNMGSVATTLDASGNAQTNMSLSDSLQSGQDAAFAGANKFLNLGTEDLATRETDVFNKLEGMMAPDRERDRLALEQRLFNQGRTGVSTSAYGGTPEQLAMQKAIEEQRAGSAVSAMGIAKGDQAQNIGFVSELAKTAMLPQEQLNELAKLGINISDLVGVGDRQGATDARALGQTAIEAKLDASRQTNDLRQTQIQAMIKTLGGSPAGSPGGASVGFLEGLYNKFFSDSRLKENITKVGEAGGYNIYSWDWNEKGVELGAYKNQTIGVIAQEVQAVRPDAVFTESGYLKVDYGKL